MLKENLHIPHLALFRAFLFLLIAGMLLGACTKDPCKDINCQNGGACVEGDCNCPEGFVGNECEIQLDPCLRLNCDEVRTDSCQTTGPNSAVCVCKWGFEGERCKTAWTEKFLGKYSTEQQCDVPETYDMEIVDGPKPPQQITLINFYNYQDSIGLAMVVADMVNSKLFNIYPQYMAFGRVSGGGSISPDGSLIFLDFEVITAQDTQVCSAILTRK